MVITGVFIVVCLLFQKIFHTFSMYGCAVMVKAKTAELTGLYIDHILCA